jgi:hypothetical protein
MSDPRPWPTRPRTVTVRTNDMQLMGWQDTARRLGRKSVGAFLAWAGDFAIRYLDAAHDATRQEESIDNGR